MAKTFKAILDRIEGKWAVLECDNLELGDILLPKELVSGFAREGDVLRISIEKDEDETALRKERISALLQRLLSRD